MAWRDPRGTTRACRDGQQVTSSRLPCAPGGTRARPTLETDRTTTVNLRERAGHAG